MMNGGGLFGHLDYSFTPGQEYGSDKTNNAPGGGSPALRKYFSLLKNYLQSLHLATLQSDKSYLRHVEGAFVYSMKDAQSRVVYLKPILSKPVKINLQLPAGNYLIEWTDVLTGKKIQTEKVQFTNKQTLIISPAGTNDKVVKLRKI